MSASYAAPGGTPSAAVEREQLGRVAATLDTFAGQVRAIAMPSDRASAAASTLAAATSRAASTFSSLGTAISASQYVNMAGSSGLRQAVDQMNQDYINLGNTLSGT